MPNVPLFEAEGMCSSLLLWTLLVDSADWEGGDCETAAATSGHSVGLTLWILKFDSRTPPFPQAFIDADVDN